MYGLTKKQKTEFIIKKVQELELTSYDIGKKTKMSISGVEKIINGTSKNPHESSLNKILEFLESTVLGTEIGKNNEVKEPQELYINGSGIDLKKYLDCIQNENKLIKEISRLQSILRKNNIPFTDIFNEEEN